MKVLKRFGRAVIAFFEAEDDPNEPAYDPVHLGTVLVACLATIGVLYWLLWTLLVYEGGLFVKLRALGGLTLGRHSLADYGYRSVDGYRELGVFEGWFANLVALILSALALAGLQRLYSGAARRAR